MKKVWIRLFVFSTIVILAESSCVKNIDLDLTQGHEPMLIIDGQLTDLRSEYINYSNYVRLTWARNTKETTFRPVDSALVIITSSRGEIDTLLNERLVKINLPIESKAFEGFYYPSNSLTPEAYAYYDALMKSLESDGGVYSPTFQCPH